MPLIKDPVTGKWRKADNQQEQQIQKAPIIPAPVTADDVLETMQNQMLKDGISEQDMPDVGDLMEMAEDQFLSQSGKNMAHFSPLEQELLDTSATRYALPIGLREDLIPLNKTNIDVFIDTSKSMLKSSGLKRAKLDASERGFLKEHAKQNIFTPSDEISRWQEQMISVKEHLDLPSSIQRPGTTINIIPIHNITAKICINVPKYSKIQDKNNFVNGLFGKLDALEPKPSGFDTPLLGALTVHYTQNPIRSKTLTIVYHDGKSTDAGPDVPVRLKNGEVVHCPKGILDFFSNRNAKLNPVLLRKVGNEEEDWDKAADEVIENLDAVDDAPSETIEIEEVQGPDFPVTKGVILIKGLRPDSLELDHVDNEIASQSLCEKISGCKLSKDEYKVFYQAAVLHQLRIGKIDQNRATHLLSMAVCGSLTNTGMQQYAPPPPYSNNTQGGYGGNPPYQNNNTYSNTFRTFR